MRRLSCSRLQATPLRAWRCSKASLARCGGPHECTNIQKWRPTAPQCPIALLGRREAVKCGGPRRRRKFATHSTFSTHTLAPVSYIFRCGKMAQSIIRQRTEKNERRKRDENVCGNYKTLIRTINQRFHILKT